MNLFLYPMPRITLGVLAGCLIGALFLSFFSLFWLGLAAACGFVLLYLVQLHKKLVGLLLLCLAFLLGVASVWVHRESNYSTHYLHFYHPNKRQTMQAVVQEERKSTAKNGQYVIQIQSIDGQACFGKLLLHIRKETQNLVLPVGLPIRFSSRIERNAPVLNPSEFNYSAYLDHKMIFAQAWVDLASIQRQKNQLLDAYSIAYNIRMRIQSQLEKSGCDPVAAAVFKALLIGQQQDIPDHLTKAYQYAGVVHILSVSGLHVGFIILLLRMIFRVLPKTRNFQLVELVCSLLFLWCFAWIAGLSPSVLRAVTVFSLVCLGNFLHRQSSPLHTLFVSALLLLLLKPESLFDIGFQLSYGALLFIFLLHPPLKKLLPTKSKISAYVWENCSVSLAAQAGTLPLCLYYFHQFPGLFLLANLFLIPYLFYLMTLCVVVVCWLLIAVPPAELIWIVEKSIHGMNQFIYGVSSLDAFVWKAIPFSMGMTITAYGVLIAFCYVLHTRNWKNGMVLGISVLSFQLAWFIALYNANQKHTVLICHAVKHTVILEQHSRQLTAFTDLPLPHRTMITRYATTNFCKSITYKPIPTAAHLKFNTLCLLNNKTIHQPIPNYSIVLLQGSPKINLDLFIAAHHPKLIIADGSNYSSVVRRWKTSCLHAKIPFHATAEKGFYCVQ